MIDFEALNSGLSLLFTSFTPIVNFLSEPIGNKMKMLIAYRG